MVSQSELRNLVLLTEVSLTVGLVYWMRSSRRTNYMSWWTIIKILSAGAACALIAAFITITYSFDIPALKETRPDLVIAYYPWMLVTNVIGASSVEELAKYVVGVFILLVLPKKNSSRLSDTIVAMILIGLGFALIEDMLYLLNPATSAPFRLLSFYVHSGTSAMMGYSLGRFRYGLTGYRELLRAVLGAICLHSMYNLTAQLNNRDVALYLTFLVTLLISMQIFILFRKTMQEERQLVKKQTKQQPTKLLNLKPKTV